MDEYSPAEEIIAEQTEILRELRHYYQALHFAGLSPFNPDSYYDGLMDRKPYKEPKDRSKKLAAKDAGVSKLLKLKAIVSDTAKADLEKRIAVAEIKQREYAAEHAHMVEEDRALYLRQQEHYNYRINERRLLYLDGDPSEVMSYFEDALRGDEFTIEFSTRPQPYDSCAEVVEYNHDKKVLSVRCRVPNAEEICTIDSFVDNKNKQVIEPKELPEKNAQRVRSRVLYAILVRTAAVVFYSDVYDVVQSLTITGFLSYFDGAYGTIKEKDVIRASVARSEFDEVDLEHARLNDLFDRIFNPKVASGLYKKKPYELRAV